MIKKVCFCAFGAFLAHDRAPKRKKLRKDAKCVTQNPLKNQEFFNITQIRETETIQFVISRSPVQVRPVAPMTPDFRQKIGCFAPQKPKKRIFPPLCLQSNLGQRLGQAFDPDPTHTGINAERPGNGQKGTNETPVGNDPTGVSAYFLELSPSGMSLFDSCGAVFDGNASVIYRMAKE